MGETFKKVIQALIQNTLNIGVKKCCKIILTQVFKIADIGYHLFRISGRALKIFWVIFVKAGRTEFPRQASADSSQDA